MRQEFTLDQITEQMILLTFSPKASLTYKLDETTTLYTRYANGFTIPTASKLYSMKSNYKESILEPETTNTYEIGFKNYLQIKAILNQVFILWILMTQLQVTKIQVEFITT